MNLRFCLIALAMPLAFMAPPAFAGSTLAGPITIPVPPSGKGEVVFFRPGGMGPLISCAVSENGKKVSSLPPGDYFIAVADPGKHTYSVSSEATDTLSLEVEPDEIQYASCHIKMGIFAGRPVLDPASEAGFTAKTYKMVSIDKMGDGALRPDGTTSATKPQAATTAAATPAPVAAPVAAPSPAPSAAPQAGSVPAAK